MFSVFKSPTSTQKKPRQQSENSIILRKPGTSHRTPLSDRKPNVTQSTKLSKLKLPLKPKDEPEIDVCSFKETKDDYADLYNSTRELGAKGIQNIMQCLTYENLLHTPTYKGKIPEPTMLDEVNKIEFMNGEDVKQLFFGCYEMPDIVMPEIFDDEF